MWQQLLFYLMSHPTTAFLETLRESSTTIFERNFLIYMRTEKSLAWGLHLLKTHTGAKQHKPDGACLKGAVKGLVSPPEIIHQSASAGVVQLRTLTNGDYKSSVCSGMFSRSITKHPLTAGKPNLTLKCVKMDKDLKELDLGVQWDFQKNLILFHSVYRFKV